MYALTLPVSDPSNKPFGEPTNNILPSDDKDTLCPNLSLADSPSISEPSWSQVLPFHLKTLTWPELFPFPSFCLAPIANIFPLDDKEILIADSSPDASPSISEPTWSHDDPSQLKTLAWPELEPFPSFA